MKTAIIYYSKHHGNTKKLIDAIAAKNEITLIDVTQIQSSDLTSYETIGFASGIYYSKFHKLVLEFAENFLPDGKNVFFLYTCGSKKDTYTNSIREAISSKNANILGEYGCLGYDTFGPFKLIGGIAKNHPDNSDIENAVKFYESIIM